MNDDLDLAMRHLSGAIDYSRPTEERVASGLIAVNMLYLLGREDRLQQVSEMVKCPTTVRRSAFNKLSGNELGLSQLMDMVNAVSSEDADCPSRYLLFPPAYEFRKEGVALQAIGVLDAAALNIYLEGYVAVLELDLLFTKAYNEKRTLEERVEATNTACIACAVLDLALPLEIMLSNFALPGVLRDTAEMMLDQLPAASRWIDSENPAEEIAGLDFLSPAVRNIVGGVFDAVKARKGGLPKLERDLGEGDLDVEPIMQAMGRLEDEDRRIEELEALREIEALFEKGDADSLKAASASGLNPELAKMEARKLVRRLEKNKPAQPCCAKGPEKKTNRGRR